MPLTADEKYKRRFERTEERFKALRPVNQRKEVLAKLQRLIKLEAMDDDGNVKCVTCDYVGPLDKKMHAGHYIPRKAPVSEIWFDKRNIHPQCSQCNDKLSGNLAVYREWMQKTFGPMTVLQMHADAAVKREYTRTELVSMYLEFSDKCKELER